MFYLALNSKRVAFRVTRRTFVGIAGTRGPSQATPPPRTHALGLRARPAFNDSSVPPPSQPQVPPSEKASIVAEAHIDELPADVKEPQVQPTLSAYESAAAAAETQHLAACLQRSSQQTQRSSSCKAHSLHIQNSSSPNRMCLASPRTCHEA